MSSTLEAIKKKPRAYYSLDAVGPYPDYSGNGYGGTTTGSSAIGVGLANGCKYSNGFSSTKIGQFSGPVFNQGQENLPFTLIATILPVSTSGATMVEQQVLGNSGLMDGLTVTGSVVSFVIDYLTAPTIKISYDMQNIQRVFVAGVYTNEKVSLFVNGELVAEQQITTQQKNDKFAVTSSNLYSGACSSAAQSVFINGIGMFDTPLSSSDLSDIYDGGYIPEVTDFVATQFNGKVFNTYQDSLSTFIQINYDTDTEWLTGDIQSATVSNNQLIPSFLDNTSIAGSWTTKFPIYLSTDSSIFGVNVTWDGLGIIVEASLDQTTWESCYNGKNIALAAGANPTGATLFVRVSFAGGILNDTSYLNSINLSGFLIGPSAGTTASKQINERQKIWKAPVDIRLNYPVSLLNNNWGCILNGGRFTIVDNAPTGDFTPKTVEFWIKPYSYTGLNVSSNALAGSVYQMGVPYVGINIGEWTVLHYVVPAGISGDIYIEGNIHLGRAVLYPTAFSASEITQLYNSYMGANNLSVAENTVINVSQSSADPLLYAHDWSIITSG